jgi:hypothetical protein
MSEYLNEAPTAIPFKCSRCNSPSLRMEKRADRTMPYRQLPALPIPSDFPIPACAKCGLKYVDSKTRAALSELLAEQYLGELRRRASQAIEALTPRYAQRQLEGLLGLSSGYLSRLRHGAGNPSSALVCALALLAQHPTGRVAELQQYWAQANPLLPCADSHT